MVSSEQETFPVHFKIVLVGYSAWSEMTKVQLHSDPCHILLIPGLGHCNLREFYATFN